MFIVFLVWDVKLKYIITRMSCVNAKPDSTLSQTCGLFSWGNTGGTA